MSVLLAFDTATPSTVAALRVAAAVTTRRDDPQPGERPGHGPRLLKLCQELLDDAQLRWADVERIGVGVGPGGFTGLRIGVSTARALASGCGAELVAVSTLEALAIGARARTTAQGEEAPATLAVIDARRGEAFAAAWSAAGDPLTGADAVPPQGLGALLGLEHEPWLGVGDGAVRYREQLEVAGVSVPEDGSPLHLVDGGALCDLAGRGPVVSRDGLVPEYIRRPDAQISRSPT